MDKKNEWSKYELNYIYDEPVIYRNLTIYPILMRDYLSFFYFAECFTMDKNSISDVKIISMTYINYMYEMSNEDKPYIAYFDAILRMITRKPDLKVAYGKNPKGKAIFVIEGEEYSAKDFEELKSIICKWNMVELPDETIQKEIRDNMKLAQELRGRNSGKMASLEDQMICVMISTPLSLDEIYKLPVRKFIKILERVDARLHYKIYLSASMSGMVEFKDKSFIKHWMSDLSKKKLDLVPLEKIQDTVSGKNPSIRGSGKGKKK